MISFGVITPNFGRPEILELWCASMERLRGDTEIDFPAVVVSEETDSLICNKYKIDHLTYPNNSVTAKFNQGVLFMRSKGVKYVLISGSDDIFSTATLKSYFPFMEEGWDVIGVDRIYFYGTYGRHKGKMTVYKATKPKMMGVGKCISSRVLDQIDWRPWNKDQNWGMDAIATRHIEPYAKSYKIVENGFIVDVKSLQNINSMNVFAKREEVNPEEFYSILSEKEKQILDKL